MVTPALASFRKFMDKDANPAYKCFEEAPNMMI